jgi:mannan endo-1,6-alpha-mannosidase
MGALIDYWYYTGDSTWNDITTQGLLFQVGPYNDYMPPNQTLTEGNDDQGFWGLAVMSAAEYNFPNPPADKPQWLALAQAVFNTQAARWDQANCNGGLRWQIFTWNSGFDYKNSISQACFFALAARLARYTGNSSYADWADKTWDWMVEAKFMDDSYYIYDGAHIETNCTNITPYQWTYNAGAFILGAAAMYNYTEKPIWKNRLDGLLKGASIFFTGSNNNIMTEVACEPVKLCDLDQQSFKAYLSRWLAATTKWASYTTATVMPWLRASASAAASQCTGGSNGRMCGLIWTDNGKWDGSTGVGQQMAAMEVVLANMINTTSAPITHDTGGTSLGDPGAGGSDIGRTTPESNFRPLNAGDYAGGVICTLLLLGILLFTLIFMIMDETSDKSMKERWSDFRKALAGGGVAVLLKKKRRNGDDIQAEKHRASENWSGSERSSVRATPRAGGSGRIEKGLPMHNGTSQMSREMNSGNLTDVGGAAAAERRTHVPQPWQGAEHGESSDHGHGTLSPMTAREHRLSNPKFIGGGELRRKSLRKPQPGMYA